MYYFIVNPVSRSGQGMEIWKQIEGTLKERNIPYEVFYTKYPGHGIKLAKTCAAKGEGSIVAIGGDGTVDEIINGLPLDGTATLSYIPVGSGNDFARGMQIPFDSKEALERILSSKETEVMDIGSVKTEKKTSYFGISSGFGYDADVCYEVSHSRAKKILNRLHLGKLVYAYAAVKLLFTFQPSDMDVIIDNEETHHFKKVYFIAGMNLQYQGGGFRFCPEASYTDGKLDYLVVHGLPKIAILFLFPTAYFAKHIYIPGIDILRGKKMEIKSTLPHKIHRDGEFVGISDKLIYNTKKQVLNFK